MLSVLRYLPSVSAEIAAISSVNEFKNTTEKKSDTISIYYYIIIIFIIIYHLNLLETQKYFMNLLRGISFGLKEIYFYKISRMKSWSFSMLLF